MTHDFIHKNPIMMIVVNLQGESISGAVNGKQFGVTFNEGKYTLMKELEARANAAENMEELKQIVAEFQELTKESYKELVETTTPYIHVNKVTNKYFLKWGNTISSKPLPKEFVEKILTSVEKKIDITPLIKCWVRFLRNTNYTDLKARKFAEYITAPYTNKSMIPQLMNDSGMSYEVAEALATTTQVSITVEGLIVGYKVSREILTRYDLNDNEEVVTKSRYTKSVDPDTGAITYAEPEFAEGRLFEPPVMGERGDEFWCVGKDLNGADVNKKGHHIRVGCLHYLESWDQVNCNDNQECVPGLHVGGLNYIQGYQNDGTVTHNIFIDPADIGAIVGVGQGNDGAMRVRRYFVHSSFAGVNKNIYHSSKFAAMTDEEYKKALEEVVTRTKMSQDELGKQADERLALL